MDNNFNPLTQVLGDETVHQAISLFYKYFYFNYIHMYVYFYFTVNVTNRRSKLSRIAASVRFHPVT